MLKNVKRVNLKIRRLGKNIKCQDLLSYYDMTSSGFCFLYNIYLKRVCVCVCVCLYVAYVYTTMYHVCMYVCMYVECTHVCRTNIKHDAY
jgi:hypothetical protein